MVQFTTIAVRPETKELLDKIKIESYDATIKASLANPKLPYVLSLTKVCPASTWLTKEDNFKLAPFTANVVSCSIFFPAGCQNLVKVRVGIEDKTFGDWIESGDNKPLTIPINQVVEKNAVIWAEIQNEDTTYAHTPTIEFVLIPLAAKVI